MASDNEEYFNAVKKAFVGNCNDARSFNEKEYNDWLERFKGNKDDKD